MVRWCSRGVVVSVNLLDWVWVYVCAFWTFLLNAYVSPSFLRPMLPNFWCYVSASAVLMVATPTNAYTSSVCIRVCAWWCTVCHSLCCAVPCRTVLKIMQSFHSDSLFTFDSFEFWLCFRETVKILCTQRTKRLISSGMHAIAKHTLKPFQMCSHRFAIAFTFNCYYSVFPSSGRFVRIWNGSNGKLLTSARNSFGLAQVSGEVCAILSRMWNDSNETSATHLAFHCIVGHRWIVREKKTQNEGKNRIHILRKEQQQQQQYTEAIQRRAESEMKPPPSLSSSGVWKRTTNFLPGIFSKISLAFSFETISVQ